MSLFRKEPIMPAMPTEVMVVPAGLEIEETPPPARFAPPAYRPPEPAHADPRRGAALGGIAAYDALWADYVALEAKLKDTEVDLRACSAVCGELKLELARLRTDLNSQVGIAVEATRNRDRACDLIDGLRTLLNRYDYSPSPVPLPVRKSRKRNGEEPPIEEPAPIEPVAEVAAEAAIEP